MNKVICTIVILMRNGQIMLGRPTNGPAKGKLNFHGGKLNDGELLQECVVRETIEEVNLLLREESLHPCGVVTFVWETEAPRIGQPEVKEVEVHMYRVEEWSGEPKETAAMQNLAWYPITDIPYDQMMDGDVFWLPAVLAGKIVEGRITYDVQRHVTHQEVSAR